MDIEAFKFTNEPKAKLIESLSIAIGQKQLSFPSIPELINELHAFGFEILPSGRMHYCAPSSLHDDCVIAPALAFIEPPNKAFCKIFKTATAVSGKRRRPTQFSVTERHLSEKRPYAQNRTFYGRRKRYEKIFEKACYC